MSISSIENNLEDITTSLLQVRSQLHLIMGEGMEAFDNCNDEIRSNYLWSCADGVDRALKLLDSHTDVQIDEQQK